MTEERKQTSYSTVQHILEVDLSGKLINFYTTDQYISLVQYDLITVPMHLNLLG